MLMMIAQVQAQVHSHLVSAPVDQLPSVVELS